MDAQTMLHEFIHTEYGRSAATALARLGLAPEQVIQVLQAAVGAAHAHVSQRGAGCLGADLNMGRYVFASFAAGLVRGEGFIEAIKTNLEDGIGGLLAESLADKMGFDSSTNSGVVAALTPFLTTFLSQKLGN